MRTDNGRSRTQEDAVIMVAMTIRQARLAVPALRHAGREIHDKDDDGMALIALSNIIETKLGNVG